MMHKLPVAAESLPYIAGLLVVSVVFYFICMPAAIAILVLTALVVFFFRNPPRRISIEPGIVLSPADGRIMSIDTLEEKDFIKGKAVRISIFLSLFNVHINRSPIEGTVRYRAYRPGKYLPAYKSHASELNERSTIGLEGTDIKVIVHQITGFIARRIVCRAREGDRLHRGERYGLIKFGSCTEILLPEEVDIKVRPGDRVKGGKTVIGVIA